MPFLKPNTKNALYNRVAGTPAGRALVERAAEWRLRMLLGHLGVAPRPVVLASNIYCPGLLSRLPKGLVFYDFNDSPFQFAGVPAWAGGYWHRTIEQVDTFFVVSEFYRRQLARETTRPVIPLGNGVEFEHFHVRRPLPPELAVLPRPLIGYVGLLSHFLDMETLEALRQARRGGTLVLIGPGTPATDRAIRELEARGGVAVLGERPYPDLPAYMQGLDVGVIPFRANDDFVRGINPNKVYQYLASGVPAVTTPVLDLEPDPPALSFASTPAETAAAVGDALDRPRDTARMEALARAHDWSAIAGRMVEAIERRISHAA